MTQRRPLLATLLGVLVAAAPAGSAWCDTGEGVATPRGPTGGELVPAPPAREGEGAPERSPPGERGPVLRTPDVKCERPGVGDCAALDRIELPRPRVGPAEPALAPRPAPLLRIAASDLRAGRLALPPPSCASLPRR